MGVGVCVVCVLSEATEKKSGEDGRRWLLRSKSRDKIKLKIHLRGESVRYALGVRVR